MVKVIVFTTASNEAEDFYKWEFEKSKYKENFEYINITEENKELLKMHGVVEDPTFFIEVRGMFQEIMGFRPIDTIDKLIDEMIHY